MQNILKNGKLNIAAWSCLQSLVCSHIPDGVVYKGVKALRITVLY